MVVHLEVLVRLYCFNGRLLSHSSSLGMHVELWDSSWLEVVVLHQEGVREGNLEMLSDDEDDGAFLIFESKGRAMYNMEPRGYFNYSFKF